MRLNLLTIVLLISYSIGCNNADQKKGTSNIKVIDLFGEPESEIVNLSDMASDVAYIPLETTKPSMIKNIVKVIFCKDNIYIQNNVIEILCFDREGRFQYKLSNTGRGPQEYNSIYDFDISSDNKTLLILSGGKIMVFNNTGTEFIFNKAIKLWQPFPSKISMIPGTTNILLSIDPITAPDQSLSILINSDCDTLYFKPNHYRFEKEKITTRYRMINESLQYKFENNTCFKEEFSDTVFFVNRESNEFQPRLIFDSHGKGFLPKVRYDVEYAKSNSADLYWVYSIIETPRYIIYTYEHNMTRNKILYDKSANKKIRIALKDALNDDIHGGPAIDPDFYTEGQLYSFVDALTLKKHVASGAFKRAQVRDFKKKEDLSKLASSIKETDNPVLIVVTPKN